MCGGEIRQTLLTSAANDAPESDELLAEQLPAGTGQPAAVSTGGTTETAVTAPATRPGTASTEEPAIPRRSDRARRPIERFCCEFGYCDHEDQGDVVLNNCACCTYSPLHSG